MPYAPDRARPSGTRRTLPKTVSAKRLALRTLVRHYRDRGAGIRYWEVANEPDIGESGGCPYRFRPESYVRYYRRTAAAVRRADPVARVGGPALASVRSAILPALLDICEKEKLPLDFVSWHIYSSSPGQIRQTIDHVRGLLAKRPSLKPETVLDEWNMDLGHPPLDLRFQPCYVAETIWQMKEAGLDWSCYYHIWDYHVRYEQFQPFFSPEGAAFMARWWNRMPQFDGLFDFQDRVRPAYFVFKLLSRLTGQRLRMTSPDSCVHGFATHDEKDRILNVLLWNFSTSRADVELTIEDLPTDTLVRPLTLDALASSDDENVRLRPEPSTELSKGSHVLKAALPPYGVKFWSFEQPGSLTDRAGIDELDSRGADMVTLGRTLATASLICLMSECLNGGESRTLFEDLGSITAMPTGTYRGMTGSIVKLRDGSLLWALPALGDAPLTGIVGRISTDGGRTWGKSFSMQPGIVELKDGRLLMIFRTTRGYLGKAFSKDRGETWAEEQLTKLPSPCAPEFITRIPGTRHLLILWCNNPHAPALARGEQQPTVQVAQLKVALGHVRSPMSSAVSRDEGETWEHVRDIARNPAEGVYSDCGYPGVTFIDNGKIALVHYNATDGIRLVRIRVDWFYGK